MFYLSFSLSQTGVDGSLSWRATLVSPSHRLAHRKAVHALLGMDTTQQASIGLVHFDQGLYLLHQDC